MSNLNYEFIQNIYSSFFFISIHTRHLKYQNLNKYLLHLKRNAIQNNLSHVLVKMKSTFIIKKIITHRKSGNKTGENDSTS
jgi:hypothetical protein